MKGDYTISAVKESGRTSQVCTKSGIGDRYEFNVHPAGHEFNIHGIFMFFDKFLR